MRSWHAPQLIAYPDSLGGNLTTLNGLLQGPLAGAFGGGVHVLPPFPASGDRGFAPIWYDVVDPAFGTAEDLRALAAHGGLILDLMVNHISAQSQPFQDFLLHGRKSRWADLFLTVDKVFPGGRPRAEDLGAVALRRSDGPLLEVVLADGSVETVWATFADRASGRCEQIDIDLATPIGRNLVRQWIHQLVALGATTIRLDAAGYITKQADTPCFMVEPDIWQHLAYLSSVAREAGVELLPEVHDVAATHRALAAHGYQTYDFVLPALTLYTLISGNPARLATHLAESPARQVTTLDSHDGIPILPDMAGILPEADLRRVVDHCVARGANLSRVLGSTAGSQDVHQINVTYRDACGDDEAYLAARAVQLFAPGAPQVYYVGLLGGHNDLAAVDIQGDGRAINRHNYSLDEVESSLATGLVQELVELIRLRSIHPAFRGTPRFKAAGGELVAVWTNDSHTARLRLDAIAGSLEIDAS